MQNCLVVINSYYKDQMRLHAHHKIESESVGFNLFSLSRTKIMEEPNNFALFEEGVNSRQRNLRNLSDSPIENLAEIIFEEMNFDRDFLSHGDFNLVGRNSLPGDLVSESKFMAWRIA